MRRKVLIVDDEKLARERIRRFICELGYDFEIQEACDGLEAIDKILSFSPDVVLLDIQMPGISGLEVIRQIEKRSFQVIFQTAYDEYAIAAFEENACDYLLKPFTKERLKKSLERAHEASSQQERLMNLEKQLQKRDGYLQKLLIKQGDKRVVVNVDEVTCFISKDHYTCLYFGNSPQSLELITELSLNHLSERLDPDRFVRCHRKCIVRTQSIKSMKSGEDSTVATLVLDNGMSVPVSRQNKKRVLEQIQS